MKPAHWQDGVFFERLADGRVRVWKHYLGVTFFELIVPAQDWCAIFTLCSNDPTNPDTLRDVMALHVGVR